MSNCNHSLCVSDALVHADTVCQKAGGRLTTTRRQVLELLWASHQPRKAYDILSEMDKKNHTAKPPTVYRALDFLQEMGLVHKIESLNAYIGCNGNHSHQYMICRSCGDVSDMHDPQLTHAVQTKAREKGFQVDAAIIEIKGQCQECRL